MSTQSTVFGTGGGTTPPLSPDALSRLGGLLAGLDRLEPILALPAHPESAEAGVSFGQYQLFSRLGTGRFGVVLLAYHRDVRRQVVVKVPLPVVLTDPELRQRFGREARAAARLDHPGIVPVYDAGEVDGLPYLVASYVNGRSLAQVQAAAPGPLPPPDAARLVESVARAVHHAHERGVLHCDLSPSNILLRCNAPDASNGVAGCEPVVTDFGLARLAEDDPNLTRTGQVAGTPLYMAPEQARGDRRNLTARSDVYALGAVLYELLTGRPPFTAESGESVLVQVVRDTPPPPRKVRPEVDRDLEAVCLKCLEKDPDRRYPSALELADDLHRFMSGLPTRARPLGPLAAAGRWANRRPVLAGVAALGAVAWATIPALVVNYNDKLATEAVTRQAAQAAADAETVRADAAERTAHTNAFYASLERVRQRRGERYPGWAEESLVDLRKLAAVRPTTDVLSDLRSEAAAALSAVDLRRVRVLADGFVTYAPAFSPDGSALALCGWHWDSPTRLGRVILLDPATGRRVREFTFPIDPVWAAATDKPDGCRAVAFSPDGRWLVAGTRGGQLVRWDLSAPDPQPVVWPAHAGDHSDPNRVWVKALAFTAEGTTLYSSCWESSRAWDVSAGWRPLGGKLDFFLPVGCSVLPNSPRVVRMDAGHEWEVGVLTPGSHTVRSVGVSSLELLATNRDGRLAAIRTTRDAALHLAATDSHTDYRLFLPLEHVRDAQLDITHLGFSSNSALLVASEEHERRIKLWDVGNGRLLTDREVRGGSGRFAFSPDGRHLAVTEDSRTVLYELTGRVRESVAASPRTQINSMAVRSDGDGLTAFACDMYEPTELSTWDTPPAGTMTPTGVRRPGLVGSRRAAADFAPDGSTFAFNAVEVDFSKGSHSERVVLADGSKVPCESVSDLRFAPDGRLWAADSHRIRVWTLPGWAEEQLLESEQAVQDAGMVFRAVAPGRSVAAAGRRDGRVFRFVDDRVTSDVQAFDSAVTALALSPDESQILVGGERGEVHLLTGSALTPRVIPDAHRDAVQSVAFGPGGWFVNGSADRTVKIWHAGGRPVLTLWTGAGVRKLAVSTDGRVLTVLVDGERVVRRWRLDHLAEELAALGLPGGW